MSEQVRRYECMALNDETAVMMRNIDGDHVRFSDYEKLLAKYNGLFEWAYFHELHYYDNPEAFKKVYEENLK